MQIILRYVLSVIAAFGFCAPCSAQSGAITRSGLTNASFPLIVGTDIPAPDAGNTRLRVDVTVAYTQTTTVTSESPFPVIASQRWLNGWQLTSGAVVLCETTPRRSSYPVFVDFGISMGSHVVSQNAGATFNLDLLNLAGPMTFTTSVRQTLTVPGFGIHVASQTSAYALAFEYEYLP